MKYIISLSLFTIAILVLVPYDCFVSGRSPLSTSATSDDPPETTTSDDHPNETTHKTDVYKVVGLAGGPQYLPASYVKTFSRWQMDAATGRFVPTAASTASEKACAADASNVKNEDTLHIQPTINFVLQRGGVPTYLLAGLWVHGSPSSSAMQETTMMSSTDHHYLAQQWTTFAAAAEPNFRMEVFLGDRSEDRRLGVVDAVQMQQAIERLGTALATSHEEKLTVGFHLVSIPLKMMEMVDLDLARGKGGTMMLTCLATAEPNGLQVLKLDPTSLEQTATSKLEVEAFKVLSAALS